MNNMMIGKPVMLLALVLGVLLIVVQRRQRKPTAKPVNAQMPMPNTDTASLSDRLKNSNAVCYGAEWCGFTKKQLAETQSFSDAYTYVDCESDKEKCKEAGINAYPTWVINGKKHEGFMTSKRLSDVC